MKRADPLFKLRLPEPLREKLEKEAEANRRSLTTEILGRLESSFSDNQTKIFELSERIAALEKTVFYEKEDFSENVFRKLRVQKGMTQTELAQIVGVTRSYVARLENGKVLPNVETLKRIAKALSVSIEDLIP